MATNIIIGIGGTGAKVVEAIAHCLAAGLGPDTAQIGFVDQDKSNGNVARGIETVEAIEKARQDWRGPAGNHTLDDGDLLRCDVSLMKPALWTPYQRDKTTLYQALGILESDRPAFDLLFMPDNAEQELVLDIGFQGRAHVGSAAVGSAIGDDTGEFWKHIKKEIAGAQAGTTVNIVLAGSAFGGSGAAGFPTIARLIRNWVGPGNVRIGGLLMLPYFKFDDPPLTTAAKFKDLLPQTRGALRYYADLVQREPDVFDQLYLVGWQRYFSLGYGEPGKSAQKNPALIPELIAALGACRFLTEIPENAPAGTDVFVSTRASEATLSWSDMPPSGGSPSSAYLKLARQIRFALAWKHWHQFLGKSDQVWKPRFAKYGWYRKHGLDQLDRGGTEIRGAINSMSGVVDALLRWAGTIEAYWSRQEGEDERADDANASTAFGLWKIVDRDLLTVATEKPTDPVALRSWIDEQALGRLYASAIKTRADADSATGADWLIERLHRRSVQGRGKGLGGVVSSMHQLSAVQTTTSGGE